MILLHKNDYFKGIDLVKQVKINHLFALAVLEHHVEGTVYANTIENPTSFYVIHPYGISLLFGDSGNESFNTKLADYLLNKNKERNKTEWIQAFPDTWHNTLKSLLGTHLVKFSNISSNTNNFKVEEYTRVNFKFNLDKYLHFKSYFLKEKHSIQRTTKAMYNNMGGTVIPRFFWNNAEHFVEKGIGYSLIKDREAASTAYSAFVFTDKLEIGIETAENYRGKGYAMYCCSALIDYCLENNYEPIWSCRFENTASYKLAQKLGFEPTLYVPFYKAI